MATPPNQMGLTGPVQSNDIVMRASEIGSTIPGIASLAMKSARKGAQRGVQGIYQLPSGQEPTPGYMDVAQQGLNNQTMQMTDTLNSMAPEDERLAYINEEEAGILKLLGGSGEMTPQGIPTYKGGDDRDPGARGGPGSGGSGDSGGGNDGGNFNSTETTPGDEMSAMDQMAEAAAAKQQAKVDAANEMSAMDQMAESYELNKIAEKVEAAGGQQKNFNIDPDDMMSNFQNVPKGFNEAYKSYQGNLNTQAMDMFDPQYKAAYDMQLENSYMSMDPQDRIMARRLDQVPNISGTDVANQLDDITTERNRLRDLAKSNNITNEQLQSLANLNEFEGVNPTTGMGGIESLRYQASNPQFGKDLSNLGNVLGIATGNPLSIAKGLSGLFPGKAKADVSYVDGKAVFGEKAGKTSNPFSLKSFLNKNTEENLGDKIGEYGQSLKDKAKNQFAGYFKNKNVANDGSTKYGGLPSNYGGSYSDRGNYGNENRGGGGEDRRAAAAAEAEARRRAIEEDEERAREEKENNREQDRFQRAFAQRYFTGPTTLEEVRKYAVTDGGYNQLTPFSGREV